MKHSQKTMELLIRATDLLGKVNVHIAKMENPFLLTYLLETIESITSNEVENIFSTVDEGENDYISNNQSSPYVMYREALKQAHVRLKNNEIIRTSDIEFINSQIRGHKFGYRKTPVTIKDSNWNIIHTGANANDIPELMASIVKKINEDWTENSIVKALLIHHEFEKVHPFADGNGRTGRILFALLLTKFEVLDIPASVISYSILKNKDKYYQALSKADSGDYSFYLETMLSLLIDSLQITIEFANNLRKDLDDVLASDEISNNDVLMNIVKVTFTGVKVTSGLVSKKAGVDIKTAIKYLDKLTTMSILEKEVNGKYRPYKNLIIERLLNKYFK